MNEQKRIEEVKPPISPDVQKALEKWWKRTSI